MSISCERKRKAPSRLKILGIPVSLKAGGQLHLEFPAIKWEIKLEAQTSETRLQAEDQEVSLNNFGEELLLLIRHYMFYYLQTQPSKEMEERALLFFIMVVEKGIMESLRSKKAILPSYKHQYALLIRPWRSRVKRIIDDVKSRLETRIEEQDILT